MKIVSGINNNVLLPAVLIVGLLVIFSQFKQTETLSALELKSIEEYKQMLV